MIPPSDVILVAFNAAIALVSAIFNISYFLTHANGKKHLRLLCGFIMLYFSAIYFAAALGELPLNTFGSDYLRPFLWLLFFIPMWDARIDWSGKGNGNK